MQALQALGDPVRRELVELIARADRSAGELAREIGARHGISQPGVSRHLKILRDAGVVHSATAGQQRIYSLDANTVDEVAEWVEGIRAFWSQRMDALDTELARGRMLPSATAAPNEARERAS